MKWMPHENPPESGPYLISVQRQRTHGVQLFTYIGYYDQHDKTWYKYDPFEDRFTPTEEIDGHVTAWADDTNVYGV